MINNFRVGFGYDIHILALGKKLVLGGVKIPFYKKLVGHSDGDCLTHSVIDAVLGALNKGDIGRIFGVKKPVYKNIASIILLKKVVNILKKERYELNNLDATIVCEKPKLREYISKMRKVLAKTLKVNETKISIKATTSKKIGAIGDGEAIASYCIVSLAKND